MAAKVPAWVRVDYGTTVVPTTGVPIAARKITAFFGPAASANDIDNLDTWAHGIQNVISEGIDVADGSGR